MKSFACSLALLVGVSASDQATQLFRDFIEKHQKPYKQGSAEYALRFKVFQSNLARLPQDSANSPTSQHAVTRFFDLTPEEFGAQWKGYLPMSPEVADRVCLSKTVPPLKGASVPDAVDWRDHDPPVVTPVKNQASCGSCWAFSAIGNIEGQYALGGNNLTSFSEQSIVDCSTGCIDHMGDHVCNQGCSGGWQFIAFDDMIQFGIPTEEDYPYTGRNGNCQMGGSITATAKIANYTCITPPDGSGASEDEMATFLSSNGPLSMAMDVSGIMSYSSGIYDPQQCSTTDLDHALLLVGYGTDKDLGLDYWIVKNSWGSSWGENGYFRMVKGKAACGVNNAVSSAVLA